MALSSLEVVASVVGSELPLSQTPDQERERERERFYSSPSLILLSQIAVYIFSRSILSSWLFLSSAYTSAYTPVHAMGISSWIGLVVVPCLV